MADAALTATPDECVVGTPILIEGTDFGISAPLTLQIKNPEENMDVTVNATGNGSGTFTTEGLVTMVPQAPGVFTFTVNDGTNIVSVDVNVAEG